MIFFYIAVTAIYEVHRDNWPRYNEPRWRITVTITITFPLTALHYNDVIMSAIASQITGVPIVYLTVCSGADQRKHQSSASLAFVWGIHRWPMNSPHKWPVTRKMFPFDDVIMRCFESKIYRWLLWQGHFYQQILTHWGPVTPFGGKDQHWLR